MTPLVILGTGGSAYDVLDIVEAINAQAPTWAIEGFLDDMKPAGSRFLQWPILGPLAVARRFPEARFINVIGSDRSFHRRPALIAATGLERDCFATLVHPAASVSSRASLGVGVYVNFGVSVAGNVRIGDHVALGPCVVVGHDSEIGDHALIAPAAVISGFVHVGPCAYIGAAAVLKQKVQVGAGSLVGMGAVVTRDVPEGAVVFGNPARSQEPVLS